MKKPTILVIESDEWLAEQYERVLMNDYKVVAVNNLMAAISVIDGVMPDLIIADILLTGGTIFGLLHELQSYGDTGDIPVVISTGFVDNLRIDNLKPYGVRRILDKNSMLPGDLLDVAQEILV